MSKYILTFEKYHKSKKKIWDELLRINKERKFKSVKVEEDPVNNPERTIPNPKEMG